MSKSEVGFTDSTNHLIKPGTEAGMTDGTMHKGKLIEVGGADGANHIVWRSDIPATIQKMNGNWPDQRYSYGDGDGWSTTIDSAGMHFSFSKTNPLSTGYIFRTFLTISGMPTQQGTSTNLASCAANIPVTISKNKTGFVYVQMVTSPTSGSALFTAGASGTQSVSATLAGTNPTTIPSSETSVGDISYDFAIEARADLDGIETLSASFTIPWSAFTWLPTGQPLIYQS